MTFSSMAHRLALICREEMHPLTPEQAKHLLQVAHETGDRLKALCVLAIHTGLRQGELLGSKWDDVDLEDGSLQVLARSPLPRGAVVSSRPRRQPAPDVA